MKIPVDMIAPNPEQPRKEFSADELASLAESIRTVGLLNPISVEPPGADGIYYLLDGERRWRATILAGFPVIDGNIRERGEAESDVERLTLALIGNLQRADMRPVDEAMAFARLIDAGFSQRSIATQVGRSFSYVHSRMVLLDFPAEVQAHFNNGGLPFDMGLIGALGRLKPADQERVTELAAGRGLSAARIVSLIRRMVRGTPIPGPSLTHQERGQAGREYKQEKRVDKLMVETACPPLSKHPLPPEMDGLADAIRKTCEECGMYEGNGVRVSCPYCAMIILARLMAKAAES